MLIYVDESGNLGQDGKFFVIAALVPTNSKRIKNLVRHGFVKYRSENTRLVDELKGSLLTFPQRQDFLTRLCSKDDFRCSYIVADKQHLLPHILQNKNICYNYLTSHLLKPLLRSASEDVHIIFDNHTTKVASTNSLADYIKLEAYSKWGFTNNLTITYQDSKSYLNLQAVDMLANTIYGRYHYEKRHLYDIMVAHFGRKIRFPYDKFGQ